MSLKERPRSDVPVEEWKVRLGDKFGSREVVSNPFYVSYEKYPHQQHQCVETKCLCGNLSVIQVYRLIAGDGGRCRRCANLENSEIGAAKRRKGTRAQAGYKKCAACLKDRPTTCFKPDSKAKDGLDGQCNDCLVEKHLVRRYGLTIQEYETMVETQTDSCAICHCRKDSRRLHHARWCVDHNHKTNSIRGLLCSECNHGLGKFLDDPQLLMNAILYLLRYSNHEESKNESESVD